VCGAPLLADAVSDSLWCALHGSADRWLIVGATGAVAGFADREDGGTLLPGFAERDAAAPAEDRRARARRVREQRALRAAAAREQRRGERRAPPWRRLGPAKVLRGGSPWRGERMLPKRAA
jgi:hypothetical protein